MINPPHIMLSNQEPRPNNDYAFKDLSLTVRTTTELWNTVPQPIIKSDTVIADKGYKWIITWRLNSNYLVTKFYDNSNDLIGTYYDMGQKITKNSHGDYEFVDWYLDVWHKKDQLPVILDQDELSEAISAGYLSKNQADTVLKTAQTLLARLTKKYSKTA